MHESKKQMKLDPTSKNTKKTKWENKQDQQHHLGQATAIAIETREFGRAQLVTLKCDEQRSAKVANQPLFSPSSHNPIIT
jgi:predicted DNA-binding protein (MmcQ/YjbR family)